MAQVVQRRLVLVGPALCGSATAAAGVAATAVAVVAIRHATHPDVSPIVPQGHWRTVWVAAALCALAANAAGVVLARRRLLRMRVAVVAAVVIQALPLTGPLLLSHDAFLYWAEARVVTAHHRDPYRIAPSTFPQDPGTRAAASEWRTRTEAYGPTWAVAGAVPALVAGGSRDNAQFLYRLLAALSMIGAVVIVARRSRSPAGVALVGWSPLVALHAAGGGHNDAELTMLLAAALALGATAAGGALWPIAAAVKPAPAVFLPLYLAGARLRLPRRFWVGLIVAAIAIVVPATALAGTAWLRGTISASHGSSPIGGVHLLREAGLRHRYALAAATFAFGGLYLALLRDAWRSRRPRFGLAAAALCMCTGLLRPWYGFWPLALAGFDDDDRLSLVAAFALSAYLLLGDAVPRL